MRDNSGRDLGLPGRATSVLSGQLTIADNQRPLIITRRQTDAGETVELRSPNSTMTWNAEEEMKTDASAFTDIERLMLERLVFDSVDNFVLAQLRGASYFTVARNVRPADANDGYAGALWNLVRVDEPQVNEKLRPQSTWRIYYINVQTGLPDRVEYQLNGQNIRADFADWSEAQGEKTPSHVRWSSDGQLLMEYRATNISHNQ